MWAESGSNADTGSPDSEVEERPSKRVRLPRTPSPSTRLDPFYQLATEIIEKIFISACPHVNFPGLQLGEGKTLKWLTQDVTDPAILSMVCKRWQNITTGYHSLWTNIIIKTSEITYKLWDEKGFIQLRACLLKSGTQPLKIQIHDDYHKALNSISYDIIKLLVLDSERWHTISFDISPLTHLDELFLKMLNAIAGRLPLLEELQIHIHDRFRLRCIERPEKKKFTPYLSAPSLNRLRVTGFSFKHLIQIPWKQISAVTFNNKDINPGPFNHSDFYEMMVSLAASIEVLTFSSHKDSDWKETSLNTGPITLRKLRELNFPDKSKGILSIFCCPALERLEIGDGDWDEILRFLDTSSCTLMHLHLGHISSNDYDRETPTPAALDAAYSSILQHPSLSALKSISVVQLSERILEILIFDSLTLFPLLETMHIESSLPRTQADDGEFRCDHLSVQVEGVRKIMESRTQDVGTTDPEPNTARNTALKKIFLTLRLENDRDDDYQWYVAPLEQLRLLGVSRHAYVQVDILPLIPESTYSGSVSSGSWFGGYDSD